MAARSAYMGGVRALQPAATPKEKSRQAKAPPSPRKHALTAMELMRKAAEAFRDAENAVVDLGELRRLEGNLAEHVEKAKARNGSEVGPAQFELPPQARTARYTRTFGNGESFGAIIFHLVSFNYPSPRFSRFGDDHPPSATRPCARRRRQYPPPRCSVRAGLLPRRQSRALRWARYPGAPDCAHAGGGS